MSRSRLLPLILLTAACTHQRQYQPPSPAYYVQGCYAVRAEGQRYGDIMWLVFELRARPYKPYKNERGPFPTRAMEVRGISFPNSFGTHYYWRLEGDTLVIQAGFSMMDWSRLRLWRPTPSARELVGRMRHDTDTVPHDTLLIARATKIWCER